MMYVALFIVIAVLEILAAAMIFMFRDLLHSVLALSFVFVMNSAMFFVLNQPLLALMQLFIMVGGVSTYLFVGVGSESYSRFKHTNYKILVLVYVIFFIAIAARTVQVTQISVSQNTISNGTVSESISSNVGLFYLIAAMLFGVGFSSILMIRKLGRDTW